MDRWMVVRIDECVAGWGCLLRFMLCLINSKVFVGDILGQITDPYGKIHHDVKSKFEGYIINVNEAPLVYQGDALFHIATKFQD